MRATPVRVPTRTVALDAMNGQVVIDVPESWLTAYTTDRESDGFAAGAGRCRPALTGPIPADVAERVDAWLREKRLRRTSEWLRSGPVGYWIADIDKGAGPTRPRSPRKDQP